MPIHIPDPAYDAYFAYFTACTRLSLVSDELTPVDLSNELAAADLTAGDGNGDFTVEAGDPDGRVLTVSAKENVDVIGSGITRHAVLSFWDDPVWVPRLITECDPREVDHTKGDKVNMQSFYFHVLGPQAVEEEVPEP